MEYTEQERAILEDTQNAAVLRDLYYSRGWEVYRQFAQKRIETLMKDYLREDLTQEEILNKHMQLQAITQFQSGMEGLVRGAIDFLAPGSVQELILQWRTPPDV